MTDDESERFERARLLKERIARLAAGEKLPGSASPHEKIEQQMAEEERRKNSARPDQG